MNMQTIEGYDKHEGGLRADGNDAIGEQSEALFDVVSLLDKDPLLQYKEPFHKFLKIVSHGANRIPFVGGLKVAIESGVGYTCAVEKLPTHCRKLYGLSGILSTLGYYIVAGVDNDRYLDQLGLFSLLAAIASICQGAGQLGLVTADTATGKLLRIQIEQYLATIKKILSIQHNSSKDIHILDQMQKAEQLLADISDAELSQEVDYGHNATIDSTE